MASKKTLRPIEQCPNGHYYNSVTNGEICAVCGEKLDVDSRKTQEELEEELFVKDEELVCGWLVCIQGVNRGRAYEVHAGKNAIGSAHDARIRVLGDKHIDKRNHGIIVYEPKDGSATLLPGDSRGLVYHETKAVFAPTTLESHDRIEIGNSLFLFIPLCNDKFDWNQKQG